MTKFRKQWVKSYKGSEGEKNTMQSETKPNETLTLRQLLINHTKGIGTNARDLGGIYTGDQLAPRFKDVTEYMEHQEMLKNRQIDLEESIKEMEEEQAKLIQEQNEARMEYENSIEVKDPEDLSKAPENPSK